MANSNTLRSNPAHDAIARRAWSEAFEAFEAADVSTTLAPSEVEQFAFVANFIGEEPRGSVLLERAHHGYQDAADLRGQARTAFWLAFGYMHRGEMAQAGGWLARAQRLLDASDLDCPERGYVRIPPALGRLEGGETAEALEDFEEIAAIGERFADRDLIAIGRLGTGQALVHLGEIARGIASLDEAMVGVVAGEVSPMVAGIVYCATIEVCQELFDLARAQEWTDALNRWCESQPDLVPFRGRCLVYRAELMQLRGDWRDASAEAERARQRLADPPQPEIGAAYYCQAELHRVRGAHEEAERAFRAAVERGHSPQPGLALLRLAQGRPEVAATAIANALDETPIESRRIRLLAAATDIALATDDADRATEAARELASIAQSIHTPLLAATVAHAAGAAALARGEPDEAMSALEEALAIWLALPAPYEAARARVLLARIADGEADRDRATAERAAARDVFEALGAIDDLRRLDPRDRRTLAPAGLTPRELRVLGLVATGMTNRAIAQHLTISEKTVARHLSNIFGKLGVSSRAAATAYAYRHNLV
jgi:DNA-binding NarL/FixJ family response regulator